MNLKSLFSLEIVEGGVKVTPSEELRSMPDDQQVATLKKYLQIYETKLQNIDNPIMIGNIKSLETPHEGDNSDRCEVELTIVILKSLLKPFQESGWENLN